jgi:hypothetical protein
MANRLEGVLRNAALNRRLSQHVRTPYKATWYAEVPFKFIKQDAVAAEAV